MFTVDYSIFIFNRKLDTYYKPTLRIMVVQLQPSIFGLNSKLYILNWKWTNICRRCCLHGWYRICYSGSLPGTTYSSKWTMCLLCALVLITWSINKVRLPSKLILFISLTFLSLYRWWRVAQNLEKLYWLPWFMNCTKVD